MTIPSLLISPNALSLLCESQFGAFACIVRGRKIAVTCFFSPSSAHHPLRNFAVVVRRTEHSVEHLYTKCRRWRKERRELVRELEKEEIRWQAQAERTWGADLVANE